MIHHRAPISYSIPTTTIKPFAGCKDQRGSLQGVFVSGGNNGEKELPSCHLLGVADTKSLNGCTEIEPVAIKCLVMLKEIAPRSSSNLLSFLHLDTVYIEYR